MANINLRPWREELRAERQRQFLVMLVGTLVFSGFIVFLWLGQVEAQIDYQNSRNSYLTTSTAELDKQIKEIEELRSKRKQLLERMKIIQDLQGTRPVIVHVFEELVRTLPDGLYYEKLNRKGAVLKIEGKAESNNRISGLMRNFSESAWFSDPNLTDVAAVKKGEDDLNRFTMSVTQVTPKQAKTDSKGASK